MLNTDDLRARHGQYDLELANRRLCAAAYEIDALRAALKPFAAFDGNDCLADRADADILYALDSTVITLGDVRAARVLLEGKEK